MNLNGRRALVTGGTSGLGAAIVQAFAGAGAQVVAASRSADPDATHPHRSVIYDRLDVTDPETISAALARIAQRWGGLDLVVTGAGTMTDARVERLDLADFTRMVEVNVIGTFNTIQTAIPLMRESGGGHIITMSSAITRVATTGTGGYAATKGAVEALTRTVAAEVARDGIAVNCLASGFTDAGLSLPLIGSELWPRYRDRISLKRAATPEEIGQAAVFLASHRYINGEVLHIDGRLTWP